MTWRARVAAGIVGRLSETGMSSIIFLLAVVAFVLVVVWTYRIEREGPAAMARPPFAMTGEDASPDETAAGGGRWTKPGTSGARSIASSRRAGAARGPAWRRRGR